MGGGDGLQDEIRKEKWYSLTSESILKVVFRMRMRNAKKREINVRNSILV
jgi:hypothetical protein